MLPLRHILPPLAALLLGSCLEEEEEIWVDADGSVVVRIRAEGDASDLADGYPVPLHGPWQAADDSTRRWIDTIGRDTGGARVRERVGEGLWGDDQARLEVRASFASAGEIPRVFAPESEPYPGSFLERTAALTIEHKGARTIYTFERVYKGRSHPGWDHFSLATDELPEGVMDDFATMTDDQVELVARAHAHAFDRYGEEFVRHALGAVYTEGSALLSLGERERILDGVRSVIADLDSEARLERVLKWMRASERGELPAEAEHPLSRFTADWREALGRGLSDGLAGTDLPAQTINGIHERLEATITAFGCTGDLEDEQFELSVHMPGIVVDGNYDRASNGVAHWEFSGESLKRRDQVMRVVSVVE